MIRPCAATAWACRWWLSACGARKRSSFDAFSPLPPPPSCDGAAIWLRAFQTCKPDDDRAGDFVLEFYNPANCTRLAGTRSGRPLARDLTAPMAWQRFQRTLQPRRTISESQCPDSRGRNSSCWRRTSAARFRWSSYTGCSPIPPPGCRCAINCTRNPGFARALPGVVLPLSNRNSLPGECRGAAAGIERRVGLLAGASRRGSGRAAHGARRSQHGRLVSKLQVSDSGTELLGSGGQSAAGRNPCRSRRPRALREVFFFTPQPFVRRVIMIGTPHRGSTLARRGIGRIGSCLARPATETDERHGAWSATTRACSSLGSVAVCPPAWICLSPRVRCWPACSGCRSARTRDCTRSSVWRAPTPAKGRATGPFP